MSFEESLESFLEDEVTIEPFVSLSQAQVASYGPAKTYAAQVLPYVEKVIDPRNGREARSTAQVIIAERLAVDYRSRITLPAGFSPNQPPIMAVRPIKGLGLDHTSILL